MVSNIHIQGVFNNNCTGLCNNSSGERERVLSAIGQRSR